ncbi:hypothetical protein MKW92_015013 [Papaver armeniacum]|nr:hypothetical protein MKW92_015013 [Papaver armeniacum]
MNRTANSGPSVGASSLVTDANSTHSGGPRLQRSASINTESYMRLPASPLSFSSNNISISGSSVMDASSVHQNSHQDQNSQQRQQGGSSATSQPSLRPNQIPQMLGPLGQEPNNYSQMNKKPRLGIEIKQEDIYPQLQTLLQQQRIMQQRQQQPQHILQSLPQIQRAQMQQQLQQQQLRQQVQQGIQPLSGVKRPYESGVCAENTIIYWRKFVAEYFAPRATRRWCLSMYDNVGVHALGVFPQAAMDAWQCDICGCRSGRGFEATVEVFPRLNQIEFDSGVVDELLFVDMPRECRFPSGIMMLEYGKAVQESILKWEFCARRHEELLSRRLLAPQVNQLVQAAQKYQSAVSESGSTGLSPQDLHSHCNAFTGAWRQLGKVMELQSLNDLGFSKRYVRCLQISEVVSSMKDLIEFSRDNKIGPIDSLKNYPRQTTAAKYQIQRCRKWSSWLLLRVCQRTQNTLNKLLAMQSSGLNNHMNNGNNNHMVGNGIMNSPAQSAIGLNNYQNLLRQSSMNSNRNTFQQEASCSSGMSNQAQQSVMFQGAGSSLQGSLQNGQVNNMPSPLHMQNHLQQQQHQRQNTNNLVQQNSPQSSSQGKLSEQMIQQLLADMMNNNDVKVQQPPQPQNSSGLDNANGTTMNEHALNGVNGINGPSVSGSGAVKAGSTCSVGNPAGDLETMQPPSTGRSMGRSDSFKGTANSNNGPMVSGGGGGANSFEKKVSDSHLDFPDMIQDISSEFPNCWDD